MLQLVLYQFLYYSDCQEMWARKGHYMRLSGSMIIIEPVSNFGPTTWIPIF